MDYNRPENHKPDSSSGVSEIIGAVLLISLVVTSIAIVAVFLFSQPMPSEIPNVKFMTGVDNAGTTLYLYHNGGDAMRVGQFSVIVDGVSKTYSVSGGGTDWSLGKTLVVPVQSVPQNVAIVYNASNTGGSGAVLLSQASANIVNSANVSPDQQPYLDCSAVKNWGCADLIPPEIVSYEYIRNVTTKRITLMKYGQLGGAVVSNGVVNHLNFTVNDANSSITFGGSTCGVSGLKKVPLSVGDKVSIYFNSDPSSLTLYGAAPSIWEMTAGTGTDVDVQIKFTNGTVWTKPSLAAWAICDLYCGEYTSLDSTLVLTTDNSDKITSFTVNKTTYLQGVSDTSIIRLNNFKPTDNGLFLIIYSSSSGNAFYVVGWADSITVDGTTPILGV